MVADGITSMAFATFLFSCEPPAELIAIDRSKSESYTTHSVLVWHSVAAARLFPVSAWLSFTKYTNPVLEPWFGPARWLN